MTRTKTLVVVTVPGVGKTWYKDWFEKNISNRCDKSDPIIFDMGEYKDKPAKEMYNALLNIIYITRKFHINSIIMVNHSKLLCQLMRNNNIPCIGFIPKNRRGGDSVGFTLINRDFVHKEVFDVDQHLSDKIESMWDNESVTIEEWWAYDRKEKLV